MAERILDFPPATLPADVGALRAAVRQFLREERAAGRIAEPRAIGMGFDADFSRRCGARGYIGMTWPVAYGGAERSALERYVVTEELLAAGAPVRGHWTSDRQSGPVILRYGTAAQKRRYLPPIARGECFFCIGLSEAAAGSDLAAIRTHARRTGTGWLLNGSKLWTTNAHRSHHMIALCRTAPAGTQRHHGLSQFIVELSLPGVAVRPIVNMAGEREFNEVTFTDVLLAEDALLGTLDGGWQQLSAELAYERSGPERWLTTFRLLAELNAVCAAQLDDTRRQEFGRLYAQLLTLREMSLSIAGMLQRGATPNLQAAIVKDLGTQLERDVIATARDVVAAADGPHSAQGAALRALLDSALLYSPALGIRGGTVEILRNTIAKGLMPR